MIKKQFEDEDVKFDINSIYKGQFQFTYRGIRALRCPFDYGIYQMIIFKIKPDLIIEIGTNVGGGSLYLADLLDMIGNGIVHTIDIREESDKILSKHPRIKLFTGGWENYDIEQARKFSKVMVIEDSSHSYENTLQVLHKFSPIVSPDSYFIVEDGIVNELGMEKEYNGGPLRAIREFLQSNNEFEIDRRWCDFFGKNATFNVNGYLRRKASNAPKVSICIPAYKQVEYLRKTLDSILMQTFDDYEIIITDDSPDDSVEKLLLQYNFGERLKYFHNKETRGSPDNWNEAVRHASGEYIKILHHDDWFTDKNSLQEYVQMLDNNPTADFAFSSTVVQYANSSAKRLHQASHEKLSVLKNNPSYLFFGNIIGAPSATIYRKKINEYFDKELKWLVDLEFYIRILYKHRVFVYSPKSLITTITGASHNVTNECINNKDVELREHIYLFNKIKDNVPAEKINEYLTLLKTLLLRYNIKSLDEIENFAYDNSTRNFLVNIIGSFMTADGKGHSSIYQISKDNNAITEEETSLMARLKDNFKDISALIRLAEIEMHRANTKKAKNYIIAAMAIDPQDITVNALMNKLQK